MKKEKLYLASNGKEVTYGDRIKGHFCENGVTSVIIATVTDATIPILKDTGILTTTPPKVKESSDLSILNIIQRISDNMGWKTQKTEQYLNTLADIMPMAVFNILLREAAIILDQKYPNHINDSKRIYCVSPLDGRIHEVCKAHIKNYRNFAAFRTVEDAKLACNLLRDPLKRMFKSDK